MSDTMRPPSDRPTDPAPARSLTPEDVAELVAGISVKVDSIALKLETIALTVTNTHNLLLQFHENVRKLRRENKRIRARLTLLEEKEPVTNGKSHSA